jgi:hypothetical protein
LATDSEAQVVLVTCAAHAEARFRATASFLPSRTNISTCLCLWQKYTCLVDCPWLPALRFKKVSSADGLAVIRHMLLSTHPAGREWEPQNEQQIYFIKEGE